MAFKTTQKFVKVFLQTFVRCGSAPLDGRKQRLVIITGCLIIDHHELSCAAIEAASIGNVMLNINAAHDWFMTRDETSELCVSIRNPGGDECKNVLNNGWLKMNTWSGSCLFDESRRSDDHRRFLRTPSALGLFFLQPGSAKGRGGGSA